MRGGIGVGGLGFTGKRGRMSELKVMDMDMKGMDIGT
jgi:hypothetical protein